MPASAQAARATCCLAKRAATRRGSFLTNFSAGGLFKHFTRAGGLMCQKFKDVCAKTPLGEVFFLPGNGARKLVDGAVMMVLENLLAFVNEVKMTG
jgi:hypothetical protein